MRKPHLIPVRSADKLEYALDSKFWEEDEPDYFFAAALPEKILKKF